VLGIAIEFLASEVVDAAKRGDDRRVCTLRFLGWR
jgi:hypothetical protein